MKALHIIENGFRATLEEQDDTIVWITHAMKGAGADLDVLLRGNAVAMAAKGQNASGLAFGDRVQRNSAHLAEDIEKLLGKDVKVMIVADDVAERGLSDGDLIGGMTSVAKGDIAAILGGYDQVWHW